MTGWDNAVVQWGEVIPVFGGYPDAPWDASLEKLPPSEVYVFRFGSRISGNMGMMGDRTATANGTERFADATSKGPLQLQILPLRADVPVYLEDLLRPPIPEQGQVIELKSVKLIPEYQFVVQAKKKHRD